MQNDQQRDERLWKLAKERVAFKWSFASYIFVNTFLVGVWFFTTGPSHYFWPIWPILGWGLGVGLHYARAYYGNDVFSAENEYESLKKKNNS